MSNRDTLKQFENEEAVESDRLTKRFNILYCVFCDEVIFHLRESDSIIATDKWLYLGVFRLIMDRFDMEKVGNLELSLRDFEYYFNEDSDLVSVDEYELLKAKIINAQSESVFKEDAL